MRHKLAFLASAIAVFTTAGCRQTTPSHDVSVDNASAKFSEQSMWASRSGLGLSAYLAKPQEVRGVAGSGLAVVAAQQRFIAESHQIDLITREPEVQKAWESLIAFCGTIQCEVITSNITTNAEDATPSGDIKLRVAPGDASKLFAHTGTLGKIAQHSTSREDKTTQVVDTEAKIKNVTSFRDNLRAMMARPSATVKELLEIQEQLTEVQSQLDSETAQRKILANETEKIAVAISLRVERTFSNTSSLRRIWNALRESGEVFAESLASLITLIVAVAPWLIVILPGGWLLRKLWRKWLQSRRNQQLPPATLTQQPDAT